MTATKNNTGRRKTLDDLIESCTSSMALIDSIEGLLPKMALALAAAGKEIEPSDSSQVADLLTLLSTMGSVAEVVHESPVAEMRVKLNRVLGEMQSTDARTLTDPQLNSMREVLAFHNKAHEVLSVEKIQSLHTEFDKLLAEAAPAASAA